MNEQQADKMIDLLKNIEELLQRIESKLEDQQENDERDGKSPRYGLFN